MQETEAGVWLVSHQAVACVAVVLLCMFCVYVSSSSSFRIHLQSATSLISSHHFHELWKHVHRKRGEDEMRMWEASTE